MNPFYDAALDIAERKLFRDENPTKLASPRIGTGGVFVDIFLWDTAFSSMWARYHADRIPVEASLDNFYRCQTPEGFISRQIAPNGISKWAPESTLGFAPPLLSWAELELAPYVPGRLEKVYEPLMRQHRFNMDHFRREKDGLFFSDGWGCGMDNTPRWDDEKEVTPEGGIPITRASVNVEGKKGDDTFAWMQTQTEVPFYWNKQLGWCDTTCQMAFNALNLAKMARKLGKVGDEKKLLAQHAMWADLVNELCFNEKTGFYSDRLNDHVLARRTICGFWPLIAQIATKERAQKLVDALRDPKAFNRPCGVPTLAADDEYYSPENGYARGPAWAHTNYMVIKGLMQYGENDLAKEIAGKLYHAAKVLWEKTGTIWENYSPEQCEKPAERACRDFCGWSALIPITYYREFLAE